jgi:glucosylceramidase
MQHHMLIRTLSVLLPLTSCLLAPSAQAQQVISFTSTDGNYWKVDATEELHDEGTPAVSINTSTDGHQIYKGWGTCFNELDKIAYDKIPQEEQALFNKRLFNPGGDLKMSIGRIAIGASDYGDGWYSCDEVDSTDFDMSEFNIDRDLTCVIPSIKLALAENPDMWFWASPWSPPTWMKTTKDYPQRPIRPYDNDQFIAEDAYYKAYCLYFDKYINAFRNQGIDITTLAYQNEAYSFTPYPGCSWKAETTGKFLADYLGPYMREHQPDLKLIFGTCNTNHWDVYTTVLATPNIEKYVDIIGIQWEGGQVAQRLRDTYGIGRTDGGKQYELWQTEGECGSGTFDWGAAEHTFERILHFLANGVTTYTCWNAILEGPRGTSRWGWNQNGLLKVENGTAQYCPEFYAYKHYSHFITPGSTILKCDEGNQILSARTPDGAIVVVVGNANGMTKQLTIEVDGKYIDIVLPGNSFRTYVIADNATMLKTLKDEARSVVYTSTATADGEAALKAATTLDDYKAALTIALGDASDIETKSDGSITDPTFEQGGRLWNLKNQAVSGDFKITTKGGRTCWNSWSNNFSSMNLYQTIEHLPAGTYKLRCLSMTDDASLGDQHAYATVRGTTFVSPAKKQGGLDITWEKQTTEEFTVTEGDELVIGYTSTSTGGTNGWFCVTAFQLIRTVNGEETAFDLISCGTTEPNSSGTYYLYDLSQKQFVQVGSGNACGVVSEEPILLFYPKDTPEQSGYWSFTTSYRSDWWIKSGYYNDMYVWFDATSGTEKVAQWYTTPGSQGVKLDVGEYVTSTGSVMRSGGSKHYLYYNGSVLAFTDNEALADEFLFIDETAYKEGLKNYFTNGGKPVAEEVTEADLVLAAGTNNPSDQTDYYLFNITREAWVTYANNGYGNKNGGIGTKAMTFQLRTGSNNQNGDYVTLYESGQGALVNGYLKVADWNGYQSWLDGVEGNGNTQWHITPTSDCTATLHIATLADAPLTASSSSKYYLYADGTILCGTTDANQADEFVFITPAAFKEVSVGIGEMKNETPVRMHDCFFNLTGQKVSSYYKGIVIHDGKKYLNR